MFFFFTPTKIIYGLSISRNNKYPPANYRIRFGPTRKWRSDLGKRLERTLPGKEYFHRTHTKGGILFSSITLKSLTVLNRLILLPKQAMDAGGTIRRGQKGFTVI